MRERTAGQRICWLISLCLAFSGCGKSGPETVPVRGKVTFGGGPCPANGAVSFAPREVPEGLPRRPTSASFDTDGAFTVTSFDEGDGLVPGRYRVHIECWKVLPQATTDGRGVSYIPANYRPRELVIKRGTRGPVELIYDIPTQPGTVNQ